MGSALGRSTRESIAVQAIGISAQAQSLVYGFFIIAIVVLTTNRASDAVVK